MDGNWLIPEHQPEKKQPEIPDWVWTVGYIISLAIMAGLGAAGLFWIFNKIGMI